VLAGMVNYWHKLIPQFATKTYNMRKLLHKDVPFKWTPECEAELSYLKNCLVTDPILKPIDPNKDLIISSDASVYGMGYCVMQTGEDGMLHAVKYGRHATTPAQSNYSADDLEATALVYALKSVERLAQSRPTTIITDNCRVLHIKDWSPSNRHQKRLLTYVMQFPLPIVYIRGSKNLLPDALSRLWQDSTPQERKQHEATFMHDAEDFIVALTRQATVANRQDSLVKLSPTSLKLPNPYAKTYKPIKLAQDSGRSLGDSLKISAKNLHPFGNGSVCEDFFQISANNTENELLDICSDNTALRPAAPGASATPIAPGELGEPAVLGDPAEPQLQPPEAVHMLDSAAPMGAAQPAPWAQPQPLAQSAAATGTHVHEAGGSQIHARDPLYNLLVKQAADEPFLSTDTSNQPKQPADISSDTTTTDDISEARVVSKLVVQPQAGSTQRPVEPQAG